MTERKTVARTETKTRKCTLTPTEEKVVRMRRGLGAPTDLVLEHLGQDNPDLAQRLAAIEQRALAAVGARSSATKRKIVSALRTKKVEKS